MNGRVQSIDALRGVTIFAMILCAAISYSAGLPAWMFHCQCPPPDYAFHPEVRGITWVDLVFPFFIFSMGAAMPFSLGRKLEKGESLPGICLGIVKRWAVLVGFGLAIGHADAIALSTLGEAGQGIVRFGLWLLMGAALLRTRRRWVNAAGWILLAAAFAALHFFCGLPLSLKQNDCIIILLSTVALLGGFCWLFTRDSIRLRTLLWLLVVAMKLVGWDWAMYLVIALPATMVGDLLRRPASVSPAHFGASAFLALAALPLQLWGLFTRNVLADGLLTICLAAGFLALTFREKGREVQTGRMGFALLLAGVAADPLCGGIAKDYCNLSYLLVTGGLAALTLYFIMWLEGRGRLGLNIPTLGRNPMIAYNIAWFVICPLLSALGLMQRMSALCSTSPLLGFCQGVVITLLMAACTNLFTKFDIYLRS